MIIAIINFTSCSFEEFPSHNTRNSVATTQYDSDLPADDVNAGVEKQQIYMSKADVLKKYKKATDYVKQCSPGFKRTQSAVVPEVHLNDFVLSPVWDTAIALMNAEKDPFCEVHTVEKGDDLSCRVRFPVFNTDYGCQIPDEDDVTAAFCFKQGECEELVILFHDIIAKDLKADSFAQIMPAYSADTLLRLLKHHIPLLNEKTASADIRYYNCEIRCLTDSASGRILDLKMNLVSDVSLITDIDCIITSAQDVNLSATICNAFHFTDFVW